MLEAFKEHIENTFPELTNKTLLIACSGGVDSVVLVHLCEACGLSYSIAHCNYRLRGEESEADEQFVEELSNSLDRKFFITHFDTLGYVKNHRGSVQMAARELRYHWFGQLLNTHQIDYLLTAHHADDTLETFIINLSRGTGLEGLRGIPESGDRFIRPLLPFTRQQILQYARVRKLAWREDSSNADTKYLRNKIRLEVVPALRVLHPEFNANFRKTQSHLAGSSRLLAHYRQYLISQWFQDKGDHIQIPVKPLADLDPLPDYLHLLFSDYGFTDPGALAALLSSGSGKLVLSKSHRLIRDREHLLLQAIGDLPLQTYEFPAEPGSIREPIRLNISLVSKIEEQSPDILYADKETLNPILQLRKWQKGDYFYPFGMKGRKKLSKFFKDEKLHLIRKESQWLLCSGEDIVWVPGLRADERFRVTEATKNILKIKWDV